MSTHWAVVLRTGDDDDTGLHVYGPIDDEDYAKRFAAFLTREAGPAVVRPIHAPIEVPR